MSSHSFWDANSPFLLSIPFKLCPGWLCFPHCISAVLLEDPSSLTFMLSRRPPSKPSKYGTTQYIFWINETRRCGFYISFEGGELSWEIFQYTIRKCSWEEGKIVTTHPWSCCTPRPAKKKCVKDLSRRHSTEWLKGVEKRSNPLLQMWMEKTVMADVQGAAV